jgi:hypothetical protein
LPTASRMPDHLRAELVAKGVLPSGSRQP